MAHDRELLDAQRVGDAGHVGGRGRHIPAWVGRRPAVAGPVVGHPADAALGGGWKQRLGRRAEVRRAVVPEHRQAGVGSIRHGVVGVQRAPVARQQIGLCHHQPSIPSDRDQLACRKSSPAQHRTSVSSSADGTRSLVEVWPELTQA